MLRAYWHIYQVLTKRHDRMRRLLSTELNWMGDLGHGWFGVSIENRKHGLPRLNALRDTRAVLSWICGMMNVNQR